MFVSLVFFCWMFPYTFIYARSHGIQASTCEHWYYISLIIGKFNSLIYLFLFTTDLFQLKFIFGCGIGMSVTSRSNNLPLYCWCRLKLWYFLFLISVHLSSHNWWWLSFFSRLCLFIWLYCPIIIVNCTGPKHQVIKSSSQRVFMVDPFDALPTLIHSQSSTCVYVCG